MNAKSERKERSHQTILQSAGRLLHEKGISGAHVADGRFRTPGGEVAANESWRRSLREHACT